MKKINLKGMTIEEIETFVNSAGIESYRSRQIFQWMYNKNAVSFNEMTNISKNLRKKLTTLAEIQTLKILRKQESADSGTVKFLFGLPDGEAVESVYIPDQKRRTVCVSSQVGCALGCRFCQTGQMGLKRNLFAWEILDQVLAIERELGVDVTNIVVMGMGEPFQNYENVLRAVELCAHPEGMAIGQRKITISTSGLVPAIRRFTREKRRFKLAVSLNAATDEKRSRLIPINKKYPLAVLLDAVREYLQNSRCRVTFEYVLIAGENDSVEDARRLRRLLKGIRCKINLIPYNPTFPGFRAPDESKTNIFIQELLEFPAPVTLRKSRGSDIDAACGQLFVKNEKCVKIA
ncbi:putative dual-specificity RNA methyltransferase RlmN [bacterium BMS3Abin05]|nr:putative dual-specificity RNA methyltransferase RlmN [bacterium BMS3Abin05]HDZ11795.1 23S rRNA (adenine(2503)-C(2))-methyltransferase RlmN [Bacteroidota bacterium]